MRPQHNNNNKNRNRNRNRNRSGGNQGGGGGGGSGANRVYDSNGPDVKLRGTAQTIAEKYMQMGRDAQSSGDTVMAESYYQFGDHYYRIWLAAQPAGQPLQFSRRMAEEDYEDEGHEQGGEGEGAEAAEGEGAEQPSGEGEGGDVQAEGEGQPYQPRNNGNRDYKSRDNRDYNNNRDHRDNTNRDNRDGGNKGSYRSRWQNRNDRYGQDQQGGNPAPEAQAEAERPVIEQRPVVAVQEVAESSNWEAPSFLTRPTPVVAAEPAEANVPEAALPKRRGRPPKVHAAPVEDVPQGE